MGSASVGRRPFCFAVSGYKNTGKTTLITRLIPVLTARGYRVATIKHDGHDFTCDVPGTDTYKHQQAGAYGSAVFSKHQVLISRRWEGGSEKELIGLFPEADIILLEGFKNSNYPKYMLSGQLRTISQKQVEEIADLIVREMRGNL